MSKGFIGVDLYLAKGGPVPTGAITNPKLYRKVVSKAKKKFKVYPSIFTKAWIDSEYRKRGGNYNYSFNYRYKTGGNSPEFTNFEKTIDMKGYHLMSNGSLMPNAQMAYPFETPEYNSGGTPCYECGGMYKKSRLAHGGAYEPGSTEYAKPTPAQKRSYPMYAKRVVDNVPTYYKGSGYYTSDEFSKLNRRSFVPGVPQVVTQEEYEKTLAETPYNIVYPTYRSGGQNDSDLMGENLISYRHGGRAVKGYSQEQVMQAMAPYHNLPQEEYDQMFYEMFGQYPEYRYGGSKDSSLLIEDTRSFAKGGSKKKWIPKNLKKGRCTPAPNPDCPKGSPQYNLAMTFKKYHGFHKKKQDGGEAPFGETSGDFLEGKRINFMDTIRDNTIRSMAFDEADGITQEVSQFMQEGGYTGYNPNLYNQNSFQQSSDNLQYSPEEFIGDIQGIGNISSDFYRHGGYYKAQGGVEVPGKELPPYLPSGETQYVYNIQGFPTTAEDLYSPESNINVQNMGLAYLEQPQQPRRGFQPGPGAADALLAGMSMGSSLMEQRERRKREEEMRKRRIGDAVFQPAPASQGSRGDYDPNSGLFRPDQDVPVQFQGRTSRYGGMNYKQGGEYELTDEEISQIVKLGGVIEYLD